MLDNVQGGQPHGQRHRKQTAAASRWEAAARVKRCGKSAPAARVTGSARQTPPGARPNRRASPERGEGWPARSPRVRPLERPGNRSPRGMTVAAAKETGCRTGPGLQATSGAVFYSGIYGSNSRGLPQATEPLNITPTHSQNPLHPRGLSAPRRRGGRALPRPPRRLPPPPPSHGPPADPVASSLPGSRALPRRRRRGAGGTRPHQGVGERPYVGVSGELTTMAAGHRQVGLEHPAGCGNSRRRRRSLIENLGGVMPRATNQNQNALVGSAGVHYVASEVRRGVASCVFLTTTRNTQGFDVVVASPNGRRHANIEVEDVSRRLPSGLLASESWLAHGTSSLSFCAIFKRLNDSKPFSCRLAEVERQVRKWKDEKFTPCYYLPDEPGQGASLDDGTPGPPDSNRVAGGLAPALGAADSITRQSGEAARAPSRRLSRRGASTIRTLTRKDRPAEPNPPENQMLGPTTTPPGSPPYGGCPVAQW